MIYYKSNKILLNKNKNYIPYYIIIIVVVVVVVIIIIIIIYNMFN